jgi:hypothetical protein
MAFFFGFMDYGFMGYAFVSLLVVSGIFFVSSLRLFGFWSDRDCRIRAWLIAG